MKLEMNMPSCKDYHQHYPDLHHWTLVAWEVKQSAAAQVARLKLQHDLFRVVIFNLLPSTTDLQVSSNLKKDEKS